MNKVELEQQIRELGIPDWAYYLEGGLPSDRYCIEDRSGSWAVYHAERGVRGDERVFQAEEDACQELLNRLLRDDAVMRRR